MTSTLIYFTGGGPLDGKAWRQAEIFGQEQMMPGAEQYEDTATFKQSEKDPSKVARVWRYKDQSLSTFLANSPRRSAQINSPVTNSAGECPPARDDLLSRREALKASRALVAERANLAASKVTAIENGTGKRIKPEEVTALETALAAMEQEAAARAHD